MASMQKMPISQSELLDLLQAVRNQQDVHGSSWVRLSDVARGPYGPDDEHRLRLCSHQPGMDDYLDMRVEVALTTEGVEAVRRGEFEQRGDDVEPPAEGLDPKNPFSRSWLVRERTEIPVGTAVISGNVPFKRRTLRTYLRDQFGIKVRAVDGNMEDPELLVLGRFNHQAGVVESFLDDQRGSPLRICSQEMLLSWIYTGCDPNRYPESLSQFIDGHPALEHVREILEDRWPEAGEGIPSVSSGDGGDTFNAEVEEGPLRRSGYRVGKTGETVATRQKVLEEVFTASREEFPGTYPIGYLDKWGNPESGVRLEKMAKSIATFCRNHKKMSNPSEQAIHDWETDLDWLKREFYHPLNFGFDWPST